MKIRFWAGVALGALLALLVVFGGHLVSPAAMAARPPATPPAPDLGGLVASFGVGGVLTRDGELWQYRPDQGKWLTLDESFAMGGTKTKLVPLPVPADQVKTMQTFGFIVTRSDACWLYDMDRQEWKNIGAPPFHDQGR
jgi:hypothetical protein